jgi:hypothetical protein
MEPVGMSNLSSTVPVWAPQLVVRLPQVVAVPHGVRKWDIPQMVILPSGKRLHNYGESPIFMGKSTISTGPGSIVM